MRLIGQKPKPLLLPKPKPLLFVQNGEVVALKRKMKLKPKVKRDGPPGR